MITKLHIQVLRHYLLVRLENITFHVLFFVSRIERMPSRTTDEAMEESFSKEDNKNFHQISDNAEEKFTFKMRMHNNLLRLWVHGLCHNILHELHLHVIGP